ncbi:unnamed protein product [Fraxinus pennsylvanica]|uniref:Uncharacterized protein n=1 Tax=Fraxinus pennsylvanica TaxID=56036 RepID=A0AAD2E189_9LAMI|nr:unnamed protein product [Fraxinus pennsylvanica]
MAQILAGRRRYFGHKPTIFPNAKKLYMLSLNRDNMIWGDFASKVRTFQRGFMGEPKEVRRGRGKFHENSSSRLCDDSVVIPKMDVDLLKRGNGYVTTKKDKDITSKSQNMDDA